MAGPQSNGTKANGVAAARPPIQRRVVPLHMEGGGERQNSDLEINTSGPGGIAFNRQNSQSRADAEIDDPDEFLSLIKGGTEDKNQRRRPIAPLSIESKQEAGMTLKPASGAAPPAHFDDGHGGAPPGSATSAQVVVNIIISFVGAGLLGVPDAFRQAGWVLGSVTLITVSGLNLYSMLLLTHVKRALMVRRPPGRSISLSATSDGDSDDENDDDEKSKDDSHVSVVPLSREIHSYGDVGRCILGKRGENLVNLCLGISQAGFATAYIIFIAANVNTITGLSRGIICIACIPGLVGLVQFRDMKHLSPFSLLANCANMCALGAVLMQDYRSYEPHNDDIQAVKWDGMLYVIAITIYSMEGVGLILSLEESCQEPSKFPFLLRTVIACITLFMAMFGTAGYWAFGDNTVAPITLNLGSHWSAAFVKCALCLGLYLTYPVMMFPIWSISETLYPFLGTDPTSRRGFRSSLVLCSALVAYAVPDFGKFLSLVGSSICTLLGFVLPCYFHIQVLRDSSPVWQVVLNYALITGGLLFGFLGTCQSIIALWNGDDPPGGE